MNIVKSVLIFLMLSSALGCVQKSYLRVVKITLDVSEIANITSVGVRGQGKPLSWKEDIQMTELIKDSIYTCVINGDSPYKFVEIKFTVNGEFELNELPNRKIYYSAGDTTYYEAKFDHIK